MKNFALKLYLILGVCIVQAQRPFSQEWERRKWQNAVVKYEIDNTTMDSTTTQALRDAFREFETRTCVRFQPRGSGDRAYIEYRGEGGCGHGGGCGMDGKQTTSFGPSWCKSVSTMVHEIMHGLCYPHYQERPDRDEWLSYDECSDPNSQPPRPNPDWPVGETLYDYTSKISDGCCQCTHGGRPRMSGVACNQCGGDVSRTLSVMDPDMINELYDCQGCYRHRWRRIENLNRIPANDMVSFASANGQRFQMCRGYVNGEVSTGKFQMSTRTCYLSYGGSQLELTRNAQIFTVPNGQLNMSGANYRLVDRRNLGQTGTGNIIGVGRKPNGMPCYAAVASFGSQSSIGKVWQDQRDMATFPVDGREQQTNNFQVLTCGN